ncbi:SDR family oxidoreductase [Hephaestia sp. GCM10023244]|uniref:SDR family oxidoreductase n=1 Tax=unclassified Hephaestia TaxID=2631281 RepID=UPI002077188A|nr:SDR family oxidoreductase [Hephaestia sp. MAHUQ-44]MCM8729525.1 SDR family oxidoreductase [Hephaestia sp. MAHUQ-44]
MGNTRCVVVTGAESGIGAACAAAFGATGADVAIFYLKDAARARQSADAVIAAGGRATTVQCAVDDETSVEAAFDAAEAAFGPASVAINSAGVNMAGVPLRAMTAERWQATIATDLTGAFLVSRRFLKGRGTATDPAALIHISSIHAAVARAGGADYCAAKSGLTQLVQTLAIEEAPRGIRVNAIRPGMILTPMNERAVDDAAYRASLEKNIPMQRAGRPEEVAAMARWLASDEAAYVTGASFTIDGGLSLLLGQGA